MPKTRYCYPFIAVALAGLFFAGLAGSARAQSQDDPKESVAEAARRAREKKKAAAQPAKTFTNDDSLFAPAPGSNEKSSPTNPPQGAENAAKPADGKAKAPDAKGTELAKSDHAASVAALERAKKDLAQSEGELDVMQRKFKLDSESYFSQTGFASDTAGKANLNAETQDIAAKQDDIVKLKAHVAELQAAVDADGPPATDSKPPAEEKPPSH